MVQRVLKSHSKSRRSAARNSRSDWARVMGGSCLRSGSESMSRSSTDNVTGPSLSIGGISFQDR